MIPELPEDFISIEKNRFDLDLFKTCFGKEVNSIRINPNKSRLELTQKIPWTDNGFYLNKRPLYTLDPLFHAGVYYVQEASSMFLEYILKQILPKNQAVCILDLCAAPGGKSTLIASAMNEDSLLVANETINSRAQILKENLSKWGKGNVVVTNNDPKDFSKLNGLFDVIVVDAPCSGEGMFRKDPNSIKEWSANTVALCSARQKRILEDVWPALKKDGFLIYSTCTFNVFENEETLIYLSQNKSIEGVDLKIPDSWHIEKTTSNGVAGYRFYPYQVDGEGFFISCIQKKEEEIPISVQIKKSKRDKKQSKTEENVQKLIKNHGNWSFFEENNAFFAFPKNRELLYPILKENLKIILAGIELGSEKKKGFVPSHELALSVAFNQETYPQIELNGNDALKFLKKEDIKVEGMEDGWIIATYKKVPLGWLKKIGNRTNNYYPKEWRIRMNIVNGTTEISA